MIKQDEIKSDGKEFERFETFTRKLLKVPKSEILRREKAEKRKKASKKETA